MMNWADHWRVLFRIDPTEQEIAALEEYLDRHFTTRGVDRGWDASELIAAIEGLAEKSRHDGQGRRRQPTGPEIKTWIIRVRGEARRKTEPPAEGCGLCRGSKWLTCYPELGERITIDDSERNRSHGVPCLCDNGQQILETDFVLKRLPDYEKERLHGLSRLAAKQTASLNEEFEALAHETCQTL